MKKKLAGFAVALSLCFSLLVPVGVSHAAASNVRVTLPSFPVKLNGHTVDNANREYPLLVYKDITYFPMTWYDSRMLGLEANWSPENGLNITQSLVASSYMPYSSDRRNASVYRAEIPDAAITVNGISIDNTKEPYPLLSFRDVTYFPLTWRFAHNQFGWDYQWDEAQGLSIQSHNPQMLAAELPKDAGGNDVALYNGYYYFAETTGNTNRVYRSPVGNPSDKEQIYSYNTEAGYGRQNQLAFEIRENSLWLMYHLGGAIMGADYYVKIGGDGKAELQHAGYLDFRSTPEGTLIIQEGNPPSKNNLWLVPPGQDDRNFHPVGDPNLMYGRHVMVTSSSVGVSGGPTSTTVIGDEAYVLASKSDSQWTSASDLNKIYRVNLKTNETVKVVNAEVKQFKIIDNRLYYVKDADNALYTSVLDGTGERKLSDNAVSWFAELDGMIYYTTFIKEGEFKLYEAKPDGEDPYLLQEPVQNVRVMNGKLVCQLSENQDYGLELLDHTGRLLLSVADPISRVLTSDDSLLLKSSRDGSIVYLH